MRRFLCIALPNWPIQRLVAARPELFNQDDQDGRPLVLHAPHPRAGQQVVACSRAAAACGVQVGMRLAEVSSLGATAGLSSSAAPLLDKPAVPPKSWHIELHDRQADRAGLEQLAAGCEEFSPTVALDEPSEDGNEIDSVYLDVTGLAPLFGGEAALARRVVERFHQRRLLARVAVADTLRAAWAVAHFGMATHRGTAQRPFPTFCRIIPPSETRAALEPLPLAALRLDHETLNLLGQLGLACVGDLLRMPRESLPSRFGPALVRRLDQALGDVPEAIIPFRSPPEFFADWSLEHPTARRDLVEQVLRHLVERVARALAAQNQGAMQLVVRLVCLGGQLIELTVGLFEPSDRPDHLFDLVRLKLERLALPQAVERIVVSAPQAATIVPRQSELFAKPKRDDPRELARLVDRLASRLGSQAVLRPRLHRAAQPELAFGYVSLVGGESFRRPKARKVGEGIRLPQKSNKRRAKAAIAAPVQFGPLHRPLSLRSSPSAVEVIAVAPDGPPVVFHDRGQSHRVARFWGPERIETSWWRGRLVRRDYYRVETRAGRRYWLFRRLADGQWFVHGEFD